MNRHAGANPYRIYRLFNFIFFITPKGFIYVPYMMPDTETISWETHFMAPLRCNHITMMFSIGICIYIYRARYHKWLLHDNINWSGFTICSYIKIFCVAYWNPQMTRRRCYSLQIITTYGEHIMYVLLYKKRNHYHVEIAWHWAADLAITSALLSSGSTGSDSYLTFDIQIVQK